MACQRCQYQISGKYQCSNPASCRLGCHRFCWVHASIHGIRQYCQDDGDLKITEDDSTSKRIQERLANHLRELKELKEELMQLEDVPDARMKELQNQFNALYDLLF